MPKRRDFLERLSKDDPNYEISRRFHLEAWRDSHRIVADAYAGSASLSDFIDGCVNTFAQGAEIQIGFKDASSLAEKCHEIDCLVGEFIRYVRESLDPEMQRLGVEDVKAAVDDFSRRINEIASRSKQRMFESELALDSAAKLTIHQKDLLVAIADGHASSNGASFSFIQSHSGKGLCYPGGVTIRIEADESDFRRLERENLLTLDRAPNMGGKPTRLGIDVAAVLGGDQEEQVTPQSTPADQTVLGVFQTDGSERPLGENPFPPQYPVHEAFEEATWRAKEAMSDAETELLNTLANPPFNFIQAVLTYRVRSFAGCADAALLIVGNAETAVWYERWINDGAKFLFEDTLWKGQMMDPNAPPGGQPLFTTELLPQITVDLHVQIKRVVAHCKKQAASRVLQAMQLERAKGTPEGLAKRDTPPAAPEQSSPPADALTGSATAPHANDGAQPPINVHVDLLDCILRKRNIPIETWAADHNFGRTTLFDWKAGRLAGKPLKGKVSEEKSAAIEDAIEKDGEALGLITRTSSD